MDKTQYTEYAEATIVDAISAGKGSVFVYEFRTKSGETIRKRGAISTTGRGRKEIGRIVGVYYDPDHPDKFSVKDSMDCSMGAMTNLRNPFTILIAAGISVGIIACIVILILVL